MDREGWVEHKGLDSQPNTPILHSFHVQNHGRLWSRGWHGDAVLFWKDMHISICEAKQSRLDNLGVMAVPLENTALEKSRDVVLGPCESKGYQEMWTSLYCHCRNEMK